jgi:hypothetical protein
MLHNLPVTMSFGGSLGESIKYILANYGPYVQSPVLCWSEKHWSGGENQTQSHATAEHSPAMYGHSGTVGITYTSISVKDKR